MNIIPFTGRAYNISVQTVSEDETSAPTTAQYRTVPLRPLNVTFDKSSVTASAFTVFWNPPNGTSEFDKYQVSLGGNRRLAPVTRNRDDENQWEFKELEAGKTYQVVVKTVSGKVTSWPASGDITLSKSTFFQGFVLELFINKIFHIYFYICFTFVRAFACERSSSGHRREDWNARGILEAGKWQYTGQLQASVSRS